MKYYLIKRPFLLSLLISFAAFFSHSTLFPDTITLDKYSAYYDNLDYEKLMEETYGTYKGIGISVKEINGDFIVSDIFINSPAHNAGIEKGDKIIEVDGKDVSGMSFKEFMQNVKKNKRKISITIKRGENVKNLLLKRKKILLSFVEKSELISNDAAYIKISYFNLATAKDLKRKLKSFKNKGINKLIIDLRGNRGGVLQGAVSCLDLFLPKGKTVVKIESEDRKKIFATAGRNYFSFESIFIVIDSETASAAEVFAVNMRHYLNATIAGKPSYGKFSVQSLFLLGNCEVAKFTVANYKFPYLGAKIKAIIPDIEINVKNLTYRDICAILLSE